MTTSKLQTRLKLVFCGFLLAGATQAMAQVIPSKQVFINYLTQSGYAKIHDVEFKYGYWTAEAIAPSGERVDVLADSGTGVINVINDRNPIHLNQSLSTIHPILVSQGYANFTDIEFDDGFWEADATNRNGKWVEIVVHPFTGAVVKEKFDYGKNDYPVNPGGAKLSASQISALLQTAGYKRIHDIELDDGYWEAEAINPIGQPVELKLDPYTGNIVREKIDWD